MNKFILIIVTSAIFSCTSNSRLKEKRFLRSCSAETKIKDIVINKLYRKVKVINALLEEKRKDRTEKKHKSDILFSRLKTCRKGLLDCKVKRYRQLEYNKLLKDQIESEVCNEN